MTVMEIYLGSDGVATKQLYARLETLGSIGFIALNIFRAQKCSERAKGYSRRYKGDAYSRKQWSMDNLCAALKEHAFSHEIRWGWKQDPTQEFHNWVLYVNLPKVGQVSFHTAARGLGPDYPGDWDGQAGACPSRVIRFVQKVLSSQAVAL